MTPSLSSCRTATRLQASSPAAISSCTASHPARKPKMEGTGGAGASGAPPPPAEAVACSAPRGPDQQARRRDPHLELRRPPRRDERPPAVQRVHQPSEQRKPPRDVEH